MLMIAMALGLLAVGSQVATASDELDQASAVDTVSGGDTAAAAMDQTAEPQAAAMVRVVTCLDNSEIFHACDGEFTAGCGRHGGTFECIDWYGDDCKEGTCTY